MDQETVTITEELTTVSITEDGDSDSIVTVTASDVEVVTVATPGPQGPSGAAGSTIYGEVPSGTKNGINTDFILSQDLTATKTAVYRNGLREFLNIGYIEVSPNVIRFTTAPLSTDDLYVDYSVN
jgi:hypothetical protein